MSDGVTKTPDFDPSASAMWPDPQRNVGVSKALSEDDLRAIEARANAATDGPWRDPWAAPDGEDEFRSAGGQTIFAAEFCDGPRLAINPPDAAFIAHAREDVPRLLAEVRRLRAERDEMVGVLRRIQYADNSGDEYRPLCPVCEASGPSHDSRMVDGRLQGIEISPEPHRAGCDLARLAGLATAEP